MLEDDLLSLVYKVQQLISPPGKWPQYQGIDPFYIYPNMLIRQTNQGIMTLLSYINRN